MRPDFISLDLYALAGLIKKKELSPVELTRALLERADQVNPRLNCFLDICGETAMAEARQAEKLIMSGKYKGPLHGIPYAAKDLFCTRGVKTTCGSKILADHVPDYDAAVVERLRRAGAVLLAKAHMHEFAYGLTNHNPHYGHAKNPWDESRITGGSSGGSGAAVAGLAVPLALGTDTGGSIRIPGSLCGVTGLKPTFGRVSKFGVFPLAWSLDHVGPMVRSARDAALCLNAMAGPDPRDPCSIDYPLDDYPGALTGDLKGVVIGIPYDEEKTKLHADVRELVNDSLKVFQGLGAEIRRIEIPELDMAARASLIILCGEACSALGEYHRSRPDRLGHDVKTRLDASATVSAGAYVDATRRRRRCKKAVAAAFEDVDLLLTPGTATPAVGFEERAVDVDGDELPLAAALTSFTRAYNFLGLPSAVTPCGLSKKGLPVAVQLVGRPFEEALVLKAADAYQRAGFAIGDWPDLG